MPDRLMKLTNDFTFADTFGDMSAIARLEGLIGSILNQRVAIIEVHAHKRVDGERPEDKYGVVDIVSKLAHGEIVQVEMQVKFFETMPDRSLFYWGLLYTGQIASGEPYGSLNRVIMINIVNNIYFPTIPEYHVYGNVAVHGYPDVLISDKLEVHFLQIGRFLERYPNAADMDYAPNIDVINGADEKDQWMLAFVSKSRRLREMLGQLNPQISSAFDHVALLEKDADAWDKYRYYEKLAHDHATLMEESERRGRNEGIQEGIQIGETNKAREMAIKLLRRKHPIDQIMEDTGISRETLMDYMSYV